MKVYVIPFWERLKYAWANLWTLEKVVFSQDYVCSPFINLLATACLKNMYDYLSAFFGALWTFLCKENLVSRPLTSSCQCPLSQSTYNTWVCLHHTVFVTEQSWLRLEIYFLLAIIKCFLHLRTDVIEKVRRKPIRKVIDALWFCKCTTCLYDEWQVLSNAHSAGIAMR